MMPEPKFKEEINVSELEPYDPGYKPFQRKEVYPMESCNAEILHHRNYKRRTNRTKWISLKICEEAGKTVFCYTGISINIVTNHVRTFSCLRINGKNIYPTTNGGLIKLNSDRARKYYTKLQERKRHLVYEKKAENYTELIDA